MKRSTLFIVVTALLVSLTTLSLWPARAADEAAPVLAPGVACKVYIRGDASGQALQYVAAVTNSPSVAGTLRAINNDWLVISQDKREYHIPRGVVLAIEVSK
jgi:hypothetical protein